MVPALTDEEVLRFVRDGFLLKRQLLDPALCARCRDRMWEVNEVPRLDRGDPNTWVGRFSEEEACADPGKYRSGFSWRSRAIGTEDLFLDLLPRNPRVLEIAEELLGAGTVQPSDSTGGVYAIMPLGPNTPRGRLTPHVDSSLESRERVSLVGLIDDIEPGGGGFGVWPGTVRDSPRPILQDFFSPVLSSRHSSLRHSYACCAVSSSGAACCMVISFLLSVRALQHRRCWHLLRPATHPLHQANKSTAGIAAREELKKAGKSYSPYTDDMLAELEAIKHSLAPVDCHGRAGDVVFYHSRLGHHAGQNYRYGCRVQIIRHARAISCDSVWR